MRILRRLAPLVVAAAVALGWWGFNTFQAQADAPEVGDCVTISGSGTDVEVETAACGGDDVLFEVTADDGECDPYEANYTTTVNGSDAVDLCLFYEVEAGDCVDVGGEVEAKVDCSATGPDVWKVASTADDAAAACRKREMPIVNELRDRRVCVTANG
ncbi:hypothetical protein [Nocardioides sp. TF02-7]|uniref:LppU/SCO3897 family protein n=1 Tax=Nocardioides sp. TF02-7 TaxID=2917724 RepID=UPI001F05FD71|nr:hypothetical protein [Nocardioides sp. TF02-7]UMG91333.1 hypothetical protein MF408_14320 [Nocardioides sp. TF02-7]